MPLVHTATAQSIQHYCVQFYVSSDIYSAFDLTLYSDDILHDFIHNVKMKTTTTVVVSDIAESCGTILSNVFDNKEKILLQLLLLKMLDFL